MTRFRALVLAGGRGSRLYPFTAALPKPLIPIGDTPVIELILRQMVACGASDIAVAVNHLADLVEAYLGDGKRVGAAISYVREDSPLGTAGSLGLLGGWSGSLVVSNGDILSDIDFQRLLDFHRARKAALTICTMLRTTTIDLGVLTVDDAMNIVEITEKPVMEHRISLGVYVVDERVADLIGRNERLEMPDLAKELMDRGETVIGYQHPGTWLDIGKPEDLAHAQDHAEYWSSVSAPTAPPVCTGSLPD